ncbi:hypothetical protein CKF54_00320 [Psittacicella hinzii]|uniref:Uncharacterized protein n=1 Tax=Psittacicella hinzii TaxID=2028575 RepID=A0A3A1YE61_9GAMM|nr:hypothetical protein [Psittacicella hinzii]RIY34474.1 hypothetical protein CKF54_00320 [Psittacicella hinzii]
MTELNKVDHCIKEILGGAGVDYCVRLFTRLSELAVQYRVARVLFANKVLCEKLNDYFNQGLDEPVFDAAVILKSFSEQESSKLIKYWSDFKSFLECNLEGINGKLKGICIVALVEGDILIMKP